MMFSLFLIALVMALVLFSLADWAITTVLIKRRKRKALQALRQAVDKFKESEKKGHERRINK